MLHEYKVLNKIQSHLITWGDPFSTESDVIVCITGNPGDTDFYIEFCSELHSNTKLPVCVVGLAGHEEVPDKPSNILIENENLFNLKGQIAHKLDLLNNHLQRNSKIHLVGHSVGAWLILQVLQDKNVEHRVLSVNLVCPTLQGMAQTKNGLYLNNILRRYHIIIIWLITLLNVVPYALQWLYISIYLKIQSYPSYYLNRILKVAKPKVLEKVLFLAYDEMDTIIKLNVDILHKIKSITNVIYSAKDGWVPLNYIEDLKVFQPQMEIHEAKEVSHAFVIKSSEQVADMVSTYINKKKSCF